MDFFISQITGQQIPYEPLTAAELRELGRPEQLRNQISSEALANQPNLTETLQAQYAARDYEPLITIDSSQPQSTKTAAPVSPQDIAYLAQIIAANPALAQAAAQIAEKRSAPTTVESSNSNSYLAAAVEPIQHSNLASDEVSHKGVLDAYTSAKRSPSHSPRIVTMVSEIMSTPVSTLPSDSSVATVWKFLQEKRFRHVPIVSNENKLIGVISDRDFIALSAINHQGTIDNLITTNIVTTRPTTDVRSAAKLLFEERIGALPVVDENENLVGILTRSDILRVLYHRAPLELWL